MMARNTQQYLDLRKCGLTREIKCAPPMYLPHLSCSSTNSVPQFHLHSKMSSRFVSSGAIDTKTGASVPTTALATNPDASSSSSSSDAKSQEWAAVQAQLEAERQERAARRREQVEGEGSKSLYDILQANKAAKQAAFEEANKIKNQFRALDEDEIAFLDEVTAKRRAEEERERREVEEGLKGFREAQKGGEEDEENEAVVEGGWAVGKKRKRKHKEDAGLLLKGVKRRVSSDVSTTTTTAVDEETRKESTAEAEATSAVPEKPKKGLSLVDYGSEDDSD